MANMIDEFELAGLREDFFNSLGIVDKGGAEYSITDAKTLVSITRIVDRGPLNATTKKYDSPTITTIYAGPGSISPVTYRRDRQEVGGGESVRIRQYRGSVPWDAGDIWIDDLYTVNFCEDPDIVGKTFNISDVLYETELAIRRLSLLDTSKDVQGLNC